MCCRGYENGFPATANDLQNRRWRTGALQFAKDAVDFGHGSPGQLAPDLFHFGHSHRTGVRQSAVKAARHQTKPPHTFLRKLCREKRHICLVQKIAAVTQEECHIAYLQKFSCPLRPGWHRIVQTRRVHYGQTAQFLPAQSQRHTLDKRRVRSAPTGGIFQQLGESLFIQTGKNRFP